MTLRRAAFLSVVLATLGAVTSVVVAWGLALIPHGKVTAAGPSGLIRTIGYKLSEPFVVRFQQDVRTQETFLRWNVYPVTAWDQDRIAELSQLKQSGAIDSVRNDMRSWERYLVASDVPELPSDLLRIAPSDPALRAAKFEILHGWPMRCLRSVTLVVGNDSGPVSQTETGVLWLGSSRSTYLAYLPLFPGLLLNTAFYGSIYFALGLGFVSLRRTRRRRRGQCPRCAYDLRATTAPVCPECGHTRAS